MYCIFLVECIEHGATFAGTVEDSFDLNDEPTVTARVNECDSKCLAEPICVGWVLYVAKCKLYNRIDHVFFPSVGDDYIASRKDCSSKLTQCVLNRNYFINVFNI